MVNLSFLTIYSFVILFITHFQIQRTAIVGPLRRISHCKNQQNKKNDKNCPYNARQTIKMEQSPCLKEILDENTTFPVVNDKNFSDV